MVPGTFQLGDWVVKPRLGRIEHGAKRIRLKPKSMAVLEFLAAARGAVVSRNQIFDAIWPDMAVTDDVLTQCLVELRKAFGDQARDPQIIETIPKRGLRLIPPVVYLEDEPAVTTGPQSGSDSKASGWRRMSVAGGVLATLIVLGLAFYLLPAPRQQIQIVADPPTIAVLAFADMSRQGDQEYLADGLAEELLIRLSRLKGLRVTGRTSSFFFKNKDDSPLAISQKLGVNHILDGSVRKDGDRLRITAQLIDASTGYQKWSESYDRELQDIFVIQEDIAESVATVLSIKLSVGELGTLEGGTNNLDAYNEYLLGQASYRRFTTDSVLSAIGHFERATELDPEYALAWERLADIYITQRFVGSEQAGGWQRASKEALERAAALAPTSPDVLNTRAFLQNHLRQWSELEKTLSSGPIARVSRDSKWLSRRAELDMHAGRSSVAISHMMRARELDPLNGVVAWYLGHAYLDAGRLDEAFAELERAWEMGDYLPLVSLEAVAAALSTGDQERIRKWQSW